MSWEELTFDPGSPAAALRPPAKPWRSLDAHAVWAFASDFRGFSAQQTRAGRVLPVLVEVANHATAAQRAQLIKLIKPSKNYVVAIEPGSDSFWTGHVTETTTAALCSMLDFSAWRLGLANQPGVPLPDPPQTGTGGGRHIPGSYIGIIDHSLAVAHPAFNDAQGIPRLWSLWDQDPGEPGIDRGPYWHPQVSFAYGRELSRTDLAKALRDCGNQQSRVYHALGYAPAQAALGHGTPVLDLACGRPDPMGGRHPDLQRSADAASRAPIVAVQLNYRPAKDTSGTSLCVSVLDALHYIHSQGDGGSPVVVNLSDGAYGGPHDGNSMLERAIDEFLERRPNLHLVLAAGNAARDKGHAVATLNPKDSKNRRQTFEWRVLPDDGTDSFMELWFSGGKLAGDEVCIEVRAPDGSRSGVKPLDGRMYVLRQRGQVAAALIPSLDSPNSPGRSMVLLALAPTRWKNQPDAPAVPHGVWTVTVSAGRGLKRPLQVDAYVERDNPALGDRGPRRQSTLERPEAIARGTLGSIAGCERAIVVGARLARGGVPVDDRCGKGKLTDVADYSSRGPGRRDPSRQGVDVMAPSDESPVLHGVLAAGQLGSVRFRMNGTSVAAPQVARRLYNLLAAGSTATQGGPQPQAYKQEGIERLLKDNRRGLRRPKPEPGEPPATSGPARAA